MAEIDISTEDLRELASDMKRWADDMKSIASDMRNRVDDMEDWNDKRSVQFREAVFTTAQQLGIHLDNFIKLSKFLTKYAERQEEAERAQNARMSGLF